MVWWSIAIAELRRGWLIKKRYPLDLIFSMVGGIIFLVTVAAGVMLIMGGAMAVDQGWAVRIFGLVLAGGAGHALGAGISFINTHTYSGTLEQVALSPVSLPSLVVLKLIIAFVLGLPYIALYSAGLWLFFPGFVPLAVLIVAPVVVYGGMMGLGLAVTGLALIFKQVQSVLGFISMLIYPIPLLVSGAVLSSGLWSLFPYSLGLQLIWGTPVSWGVVGLVTVSWFLIGYLCLSIADGAARRRGVLGLY